MSRQQMFVMFIFDIMIKFDSELKGFKNLPIIKVAHFSCPKNQIFDKIRFHFSIYPVLTGLLSSFISSAHLKQSFPMDRFTDPSLNHDSRRLSHIKAEDKKNRGSSKIAAKMNKKTVRKSDKKTSDKTREKQDRSQFKTQEKIKPQITSIHGKSARIEQTEKKAAKSLVQPMNSKTLPRKQMKKSLKTTSQTNEFFYMVNPKTEKMQKFMIHQGEKINSRLNEKSEYIPPFQTCDQDCDSSDEIVQKGIQFSRQDLFRGIAKRNPDLIKSLKKQNQRSHSSKSSSETIGARQQN